ncbi:MAG: asparagine synthase (glutamine-hydrolyzing) [Elusimicrobia bacterium]|nr:asparagine synthase (glutamine-hydrolyzing) [Elusimicrobiota bacterium]
MCGIAGIFNYRCDKKVDKSELISIRDYMISRGPDGFGEWRSEDKKIGLAHRRLAIIDLTDKAQQPMISKDGNLVIVFNGEIYNYKELKKELQDKGYKFKTNSDTEVILNLYRDKGENMLQKLRGMFSFCLWDEKRHRLFAARDPFGIKPFYYYDDGKTIYIASQVKSLLKSKNINIVPNSAGHVGFFLFGYIPDPHTLYKNIHSLPAGSYMMIEQGKDPKIFNYYNIKDMIIEAKNSDKIIKTDIAEELRNIMTDTVKHHLVSDVPVGLFLSSGLDSTTLLALISEISTNQINTVTLGFEEYKGTANDETVLASAVAKQYNANHQTIWISKNDFNDKLENIIKSMDQPTTDGINSYLVSMAAKKAGLKVAISGLGGDEIFGSYPSFKQIPKLINFNNRIAPFVGSGEFLRKISLPFFKKNTSPKYAGLFEYGKTYGGAYLLRRGMFMPYELEQVLDADIVNEGLKELNILDSLNNTVEGIGNDYLSVSCLELSCYMRNQLLRDIDWASMAHSLEVRTPFVDINFFKSIVPLLLAENRPNKLDMANTPNKKLSKEILYRNKTGFSVPVKEWAFEKSGTNSSKRRLRGWGKTIYKTFEGNELAVS